MKFNLLCDELGIHSAKSDAENLALLQQWFQEHVSLDIQFTGDEKEQFKLYKELTEVYFDNFLPEAFQGMSKRKPELHEAASLGFDRALLSLKPESDSLDLPNANGMTSLHISAIKGHFNTVQVLLSLGANPSILNKQNQHALFSALFLPILHNDELKRNKIKIFALLMEKEPQLVKHQDESGNTVLHQMASQGFETLIKEILKRNPDLARIKNNHSHYPIHTAILNNQNECVKLLLEVKDTEILADANGWVPLHYAARYGGNEILKQCCDVSADIDITDKLGRSPLMLAAALGRLFAVKALIGRGAQIDLTDLQGFTVFHHAIQSTNLEVVRWLADNTAVDINAQDALKRTPTSLSEMSGAKDITNFLRQSSRSHGQ